MAYSKEDYENEPVHYCATCLSLNVREFLTETQLDVCRECGNTDIKTASMDQWNQLYTQQYGAVFMDTDLDYDETDE